MPINTVKFVPLHFLSSLTETRHFLSDVISNTTINYFRGSEYITPGDISITAKVIKGKQAKMRLASTQQRAGLKRGQFGIYTKLLEPGFPAKTLLRLCQKNSGNNLKRVPLIKERQYEAHYG